MKNINPRTILLCILGWCVFYSIDTNAQGWQWGINSTQNQSLEPWSSVGDRNGNVFTAIINESDSANFGLFRVHNYSGHGKQMIVLKAEATGNYLWAIGAQGITNPASNQNIATDASGNLYVLGVYDSGTCTIGGYTLTGPTDSSMYFITKISPVGAVLWAKNVVVSSGFSNLMAYLGVDSTGNVYISGNFTRTSVTIGGTTLVNTDTGNTYDVFVAKFDTGGNAIWAKNFGGTSWDLPTSFAVSPGGDVYVFGYFYSLTITIGSTTITNPNYSVTRGVNSSENFFVCYDRNGNPIWAKSIERHLIHTAMKADRHGSVYVAGVVDSTVILGSDTLSVTVPGHENIFVAKYSSMGNVTWARSITDSATIVSYSVDIDSLGKIFVTGSLKGTQMNITGHILFKPVGSSYDPMFIAEYDSSGNYMMSIALRSGGDDYQGIVTGNYGCFYVVGDYVNATMVFGEDTLRPNSTNEILFIARYKYDSAVVKVDNYNVLNNKVFLYPNPATTELNIACTEKITHIAITNLLGQMVYTHEYDTEKVHVDVANFVSGVYLVTINGSEVRRFVKE